MTAGGSRSVRGGGGEHPSTRGVGRNGSGPARVAVLMLRPAPASACDDLRGRWLWSATAMVQGGFPRATTSAGLSWQRRPSAIASAGSGLSLQWLRPVIALAGSSTGISLLAVALASDDVRRRWLPRAMASIVAGSGQLLLPPAIPRATDSAGLDYGAAMACFISSAFLFPSHQFLPPFCYHSRVTGQLQSKARALARHRE